ncbi:MAG: lytic transglycosylase domain-containing protein [Deltaproteobacteria bacterium]|jgi:soluble lytic murein transglycosylase-like protein|nr:lytic transglycosylase domain-containing protein [Deltaproteobacteria bacterium]
MKTLVACLFLLLITPMYAWGMDFMPHVSEACAKWNVHPKLIRAIMQQESGGKPWAVNVAGKSYIAKSRAEAVRIALAAQQAGKSYDIGLMQINSWWLKKFNLHPDFAIDPRNNIMIGAWILAGEIRRYGLKWEAVASYHTPVGKNPERAKRYAQSVINQMQRLP